MSCDYDQKSNMKSLVACAPATLTADSTPIPIDTTGFKAATVHCFVGAGGITFNGTNFIAFQMTHSDDNITYIPVTDNEVILDYGQSVAANVVAGAAAGTIRLINTAHAAADAGATLVGYIGKKVFLQVLVHFAGTHGTGTAVSSSVTLSHPMSAPVNQPAYEH